MQNRSAVVQNHNISWNHIDDSATSTHPHIVDCMERISNIRDQWIQQQMNHIHVLVEIRLDDWLLDDCLLDDQNPFQKWKKHDAELVLELGLFGCDIFEK